MHPESTYSCILQVIGQIWESQERIIMNTNHRLTFISLFSLIVYSVRFNPSNKRFHLLIFPCLPKRMALPRSSRSEVFCRKSVLRNSTKFTGKHVCQRLLLIKRIWHRFFPLNFAEFLRTLLLIEHLRWLVLTTINNEDRKWFEIGKKTKIYLIL